MDSYPISYRWWRTAAISGIVLFILLASYFLYLLYAQGDVSQSLNQPIASAAAQQYSSETARHMPMHIALPAIDVSLPVVEGTYDHTADQWSVRDGAANFALVSHTPSEQNGVTFIYGHARDNAFGRLSQLENHASAIITDTHGAVFEYRLDETQTREYQPDDTSLLRHLDGQPRLILMTCDGWMSEKRIVYEFHLREKQ